MRAHNLLMTAAFAAFSVTAFGVGADYVKFRTAHGSGSYNKFDQNPVGHSITINADGRTGRYCVNGSSNCGQLFDIQFDQDGADMRGKWNLNGSRGTFVWNFSSDKEFEGGFRFNQNMKPSKEADSIYVPFDGEWNGQFR